MSLRLQRPNERSDTVCDEKKKTGAAQTHGSRKGSTMPDCCGPMVRRMFRAFGGTAEGAANGESAREHSAEWVRSCASMMEEMSSKCCGPSPQRTTGDE